MSDILGNTQVVIIGETLAQRVRPWLIDAGCAVFDGCDTLDDAVTAVKQAQPDLVLLLERVFEGQPAEICSLLKQVAPATQIVLARSHDGMGGPAKNVVGADAEVSDIIDRLAIVSLCHSLVRAASAERALQRTTDQLSRDRIVLHAIIDQLPCGLALAEAPSGKLLLTNQEAERLLGHPLLQSDNVAGYTRYGAVHQDGTLYKPEEHPLARALERNEVRDESLLYRRGDGELTNLLVSAGPVLDERGKCIAAVSTFFSADELVARQRDLAASKRRVESELQLLRTIIDRAPVAMSIMRAPDFLYEVINPAFQALAPGKQMLGRKFADVWAEVPQPLVDFLAGVIASGKTFQEIDSVYQVSRYPGAQPEEIVVTYSWIPLIGEDGEPDRILTVAVDTTMHKQAEDGLRHALAAAEKGRALLDALMEHMPLGLTIAEAPEGQVVAVSRFGCDLVGMTREEITNIPLEGRARHLGLHHSNGVTPLEISELPLYRATILGEIFNGEEVVAVRHDGRRVPLLCTGAPICDGEGNHIGGVVAWQDMTRWKDIERSLRDSEAQFRAVFEQAAVGIARVGRDGRWLEVNSRLADMVGYSASELLQLTFEDITHPDDVGADWHEARRLAAGTIDAYHMEKRYIHKNGSIVWVQLSASVVRNPDGTPNFFIAVVEDITARRQAQDSLARSNRALQQFAYAAAHDLQEPLRNVSTCSELLLRNYADQLPEDARTLLRMNVDSGQRMHRMVKDLLSYTKVVGERPPPTPFADAAVALQEAISDLSEGISEARAEIRAGWLPRVRMHHTHLVQLFQNLVANSLKYRKPGESAFIEVSVDRRAAEWVFAVRDNGIGFDPVHKERIFGIFKRLHTAHQYPGTGIGLAICARIVEHYGGRIWAESAPGQGATFFVAICAEESTSDAANSSSVESAGN